MKNPRLIYIRWRDPVSLVAWASDDEVRAWVENNTTDGGIIESVGWVFLVSDNYIVFAPHRSVGADQADEPNMSDVHKIPIANIIEVRSVTIGNKWNGWK